jgi:FtsZ-binding cell division protein ZapB
VADEGAAETKVRKALEALEQCEEKVQELREENSQLRQSAEVFGDLAERLNKAGRGPVRSRPEETTSKR